MKNVIVILTMVLLSAISFAQEFSPADAGSSVRFAIKNLGITANGSFKGLTGSVQYNSANPASSKIEVSVDAATVNTGIDARDNHLRKSDYFDVKKHPKIIFVSDHITKNPGGDLQVHGKLTIKGVTKPISFPFTAAVQGDGYLFKGEFKLNRRDFNVGKSSLVLSDVVVVSLNVLVRQVKG